ncbi:MAG: F0F1 ATP synthase subunit B [Micrococcales bacterium]|nr:MAG: F0F1 ATP synthase subunit B [Micrococcales bacterium]PIE27677.1 MAG: F0F1 ATP synthase subunit B [Micrococcales bacterium]
MTGFPGVLAKEGEEGFWATAYPILPHPGELIIGAIAFALLYWVMSKVVVPQFEEAYARRREAISGGMAKAEQAQEEAEAARAELQERLAEAKAEATQIREEARSEASVIAQEIRSKAQGDAERLQASASRQIEAERANAEASLRRDIGGLATTLAGRIVGESLDDQARQSRVIDRFLSELEQTPARSGDQDHGGH